MYYLFNPNTSGIYRYIHPIKEPLIRALIQELPDSNIFDLIFLFGSSLDIACDQFSDIDLYALTQPGLEAEGLKLLRNVCRKLRISADILCSNFSDFIEDAVDISSVESAVLERSLVLYDSKDNTA